MESKPANAEELFQKLKDYAELRFDLLRLKAINKLSGFLSSFISIFIIVIIFSAIVICITVAVALLIGSWLGKVYWGFFIIAAIYLIIGLVLYSKRGSPAARRRTR